MAQRSSKVHGLVAVVMLLLVIFVTLALVVYDHGPGSTALAVYDPGVGSNIHRGNVQVTLDKPIVSLQAGNTATVAVDADPWQDSQLPGCEMAECPDSCGEKGCLASDGINCTCNGTTFQTYATDITVSSSNPGAATASYSNRQVTVTGVAAGTATITVTGKLREWTPDAEQITVTVTANNETPGGGSSGGGVPSVSPDVAKTEIATASYDTKGNATITAASLKNAAEVKITGVVGLVLDAGALQTIGTAKDLKVSATKVDSTALAADLQQKIGSRPVFDINITSGGKAVTDLGAGKLQISIPYNLAAGESAGQIVAYRIAADGTLAEMSGACYDAAAKAVVFTTDHLSRYAVGYQKAEDRSFTDVPADYWAAASIGDLVGKGIIKGKTATTFAPDDPITRAEFVTILAGMAGADVKTAAGPAFGDVAADTWYAPYVAWAGEAGIAKGEDGQFHPDAQITRQDMATMLAGYVQGVARTTLPAKNSAIIFNDEQSIGAYAKDAVGMMQQVGIVGGYASGDFLPANSATRAEAASMISALMGLLPKK